MLRVEEMIFIFYLIVILMHATCNYVDFVLAGYIVL